MVKLTEEINNCLQKAEQETNLIYEKLDLDNKFDEWFKDLDRETKLSIYKTYELQVLEDF